MSSGPVIVAALVGYVLGALPVGYVVARAYGVDIFKVGSGNPGATNVKRTLGARAGYTVFALDALKGAVATGWPLVALALLVADGGAEPAGFSGALAESTDLPMVVGLIAAVLGHSFSVFTGFRGGKGVATAAGGLVVLLPVVCLVAGAVWVVAFFAFRYVSLASILAAASVPVASWLTIHSLSLNLVATALGAFVIVRHRTNIQRLLRGTENKFAKKPRETETS
jgi:acyl phosphate:glycerol-3-phosphate acyltransferase